MPTPGGAPAGDAGGAPRRWRLSILPSSAGPYKWKTRVAQVDAAEVARRARVAPVLKQVKRIEVLAALPPVNRDISTCHDNEPGRGSAERCASARGALKQDSAKLFRRFSNAGLL